MHRVAVRLIVLFLFAIAPIASWADPALPTLFTDHLVLQRGRAIHVWGWGETGEKITVTLAAWSATATTDAAGHWSVSLPAMTAGGPFTMHVRGKKEILVKDVLIGEVWVASGQSNMSFALDGAAGAAEEVPKANYPEIRLFTVPKKIALAPEQNTRSSAWQICTPDSAKSFSAVAYFFARDLHAKLGVPIGVIHTSWPGTAAEAWTDSAYLQGDAELKPLWEQWQAAHRAARSTGERSAQLHLEFDDFELLRGTSESPEAVPLANFDDGRLVNSLGGDSAYQWGDGPDTVFELNSPGRGGHGYSLSIAGALDGTQQALWSTRFHPDDSPADLSKYTGIRFWVRGSGEFRLRTKQPTIFDYDDYGVPLRKATEEWQPVTVLFHDFKQDGWGVVQDFTPAALTGFAIEAFPPGGGASIPVSGLFDGMFTPVAPYAFRGVIWYQGESNTGRAHQYRKLLPALIESWRHVTQQPDMDFLIVQLPNHGGIPEQPGDSWWAELREAQFLAFKSVPHTGLAVTMDVGDAADLHPHRKREVGERLALWALGTTYGKPIHYSGPLYDSMKVEGKQVRIRFTQTGDGLEARGGALQGFAIAGSDRKFRWAEARIEDDAVIVSSAEVPDPVAVRYAWGDSPPCNLFNRDGLPASPFRTDTWPGVTEGK